jgi:hypothetical protein
MSGHDDYPWRLLTDQGKELLMRSNQAPNGEANFEKAIECI